MASEETVLKMFALLHANWPTEVVPDERIDLYARMLGDLSDEMLEAATLHVIGSTPFSPKVADIRKAAYEIYQQEMGLPTAGEAWGEVMQQIRRVGSYGRPEFSQEIIGAAVKAMGGWVMLCRSEEPMADRAHFFRVYDALAERKMRSDVMLPQVKEVAKRLSMGIKLGLLEGGR